LNDDNGARRWFLLSVATVAQVGTAVIRFGIPALMPLIRLDLGLDRTQVGLVSTVLNTGAAAAGIPSGKAVDRLGERRVIGYGTIACGAVILCVGAAWNFAILLPILIATGFLSTTSVPAGGKVVARWFRDNERATAMGIRQTGVSLGGAIAAAALPPLALLTSWRAALGVAGICAIVIGLASLYLYDDPPDAAPRDEHGTPIGIGTLAARNDTRAVLAYTFLFGGAQWCYLTYLTLYLTEAVHLSVVVAGTLLAIGQLCGTFGRIGWGVMSDRLMAGRRRRALLLVGTLAVLMTTGMALMAPDTPFAVIAIVVALLGLSVQGWNGLAHTLASELAGERAAGVAVGLNNSVGFLGVMLWPPIFGAIVDWTDSYRAAWLMLAGLLVVAMAALMYVRESNNRGAKGRMQ